jgi:hypothetical protein
MEIRKQFDRWGALCARVKSEENKERRFLNRRGDLEIALP